MKRITLLWLYRIQKRKTEYYKKLDKMKDQELRMVIEQAIEDFLGPIEKCGKDLEAKINHDVKLETRKVKKT